VRRNDSTAGASTGKLAAELGAKFAMAIGDNFYSHGITAASGHGAR
jgi:hypothetical protein